MIELNSHFPFKNVILVHVSVVYLILVDYPGVNIKYRITCRKYSPNSDVIYACLKTSF